MSGLFRTGDIDEKFLKFCTSKIFIWARIVGQRQWELYLGCVISRKTINGLFGFKPIFLGGFKKQLNRYSGPILKYVMDIQGAAWLDFVMS